MKYKLFFLLISMFFMILENKSQTLETNCLHYPYNTQVGINLNANLLSKMAIEPYSDYFHSYPSLGAGLGVYLYQRVYKWFGIQIGAEFNVVTMRYASSTNFTGLSKDISMKYHTETSTFPILFNASYYFNARHGFDISLGCAPLIILSIDAPMHGAFTRIESDYNEEGGYYNFAIGNYPRFNISLYGKIGYNFLFENKNTIGVSIIGSYATESYAQGYYYVLKNATLIEEGHTYLRNTFIGLQFSYGFTMKKLLCVPKLIID